jgi:hypothetical protein
LLIAIVVYLHLLVLFRPLPLLRQGVLRFAFITAQLVSARASQTELEARAQISRYAQRSAART